jgi:flagellar hook-basal body complex protein FliE
MDAAKTMGSEMAGLIKADAAALAQQAQGVAPAIGGGAAGFSFAQSMKDALVSVNQEDRMAAQRMEAVDSGKSDDLVGAMLASQQASLSFSMLLQVRNKVMGAVDELLKLPV